MYGYSLNENLPRIILEYCQMGDLKGYLSKINPDEIEVIFFIQDIENSAIRMKGKFRKNSFPSAGKLATEWFHFTFINADISILLVLHRFKKYYTQRFSCKECSFNQ